MIVVGKAKLDTLGELPTCGPLVGTPVKSALRRLPLGKINVTIWKVLVEVRRSRPNRRQTAEAPGSPIQNVARPKRITVQRTVA